jgi:tyrosinase
MDVDLHRRTVLTTLLQGSALGLAGLALGGCETLLEQIRNRPMRRDLATLPANDPIIDTYKAAVSAMKALPSSDPRNWTRQAEIHLNHCPHGNWFFLPWHRAYLLFFEQICRELTGNTTFALPYWNWACNRSIPSVFFGGASNPLFDGTRTKGPTDTLPLEVVGPNVITGILDEPNFLIFASGPSATQQGLGGSGPLEATPHNNVHGWISGNMGSYMSPLDPVFWTHHNVIDRIWWDWNVVKGFSNTNDPAWANFRFTGNFVDRNGASVDAVAGAMVLGPLLLYQFDQSSLTSCGSPFQALAIRDARALQRFLEVGAPVQLRTLRRLQTSAATEVPVGRSSTQVLRSREATSLAESSLPKDVRVLVRTQVARQPPSGEYFVRVFINRPDATAETPISDPHYAGSFGFFNDEKAPHARHAEHAGPSTFVVDATPAIQRLRAMDRIRSGGDVTVQVVAVPMPGVNVAPRSLPLAAVQLDLAESVTAAPKPLGLPADKR